MWSIGNLEADVQLALGMSAVFTWWIGSLVFCFGATISRPNMFPLCSLHWLFPLPSVVLNTSNRLSATGVYICSPHAFHAGSYSGGAGWVAPVGARTDH